MTTLNTPGYNFVFELARQLISEDRIRLREELVHIDKRSILPEPEMTCEEYYKFLIQCPVIDEESIQKIQEAKGIINQWKIP